MNGFTNSADFPTTVGAFQRALAGGFDVFSVKLTIDDTGDTPAVIRRAPVSRAALSTARQSGSLLDRAELLCSVSSIGCLPLN